MSANPFITHRMFVAALSPHASGTGTDPVGHESSRPDQDRTWTARSGIRRVPRPELAQGVLLADAMLSRFQPATT